MKSMLLAAGVIASGLGLAIAVPSAIAGEAVTLPSNIGAIFQTEPDFFEAGREQFEAEIDRLMQPEPATAVLTIDEQILFEHDSLPELEQLPPITPARIEDDL